MNRRTILKAGLVIAASSHTAVATAETSAVASVSIDDFLAHAEPSEIVRYHANALAEAMAVIHPGTSWRASVNHPHRFALIVGDDRPAFVTRMEV